MAEHAQDDDIPADVPLIAPQTHVTTAELTRAGIGLTAKQQIQAVLLDGALSAVDADLDRRQQFLLIQQRAAEQGTRDARTAGLIAEVTAAVAARELRIRLLLRGPDGHEGARGYGDPAHPVIELALSHGRYRAVGSSVNSL